MAAVVGDEVNAPAKERQFLRRGVAAAGEDVFEQRRAAGGIAGAPQFFAAAAIVGGKYQAAVEDGHTGGAGGGAKTAGVNVGQPRGGAAVAVPQLFPVNVVGCPKSDAVGKGGDLIGGTVFSVGFGNVKEQVGVGVGGGAVAAPGFPAVVRRIGGKDKVGVPDCQVAGETAGCAGVNVCGQDRAGYGSVAAPQFHAVGPVVCPEEERAVDGR